MTEPATLTITQGAFTVTINVDALTENLSTEQLDHLAESALLEPYLFSAMKNRLTGSAMCWSGRDNDEAFDFLTKCQAFALRHKFEALDRLCDRFRDTLFESRLYWKLYHSDAVFQDGTPVRDWFWRWAKANGFDSSNYCDKEAGQLASDFAETILAEVREILAAEPELLEVVRCMANFDGRNNNHHLKEMAKAAYAKATTERDAA